MSHAPTVEDRARTSHGTSGQAIYQMVARALRDQHAGGTLVDIGAGTGSLWSFTRDQFRSYIGVDVVRYDGFPADGQFCKVDLDSGRVDLPDESADVVACVETIEHVENPRALVRELVRLVRPGGLVVVTTPNQLSLLSKLGLLLKNQFPAFQEAPGLYPTHLSALLEIDLVRIARECGLLDISILYSNSGRIPGTGRHWPFGLGGRAFSDNILLRARRPSST